MGQKSHTEAARVQRAKNVDEPTKIGEERFEVPSQSDPNKTYVVDVQERSCSCPDHRFRGVTCKHMYRVIPELDG